MKKILALMMLLAATMLLISESTTGEIDLEEKSEDQIKQERIFEDLENEYYLAKIFFNSEQKRYYKKLDEPGKRIFLDAFWAANDPNPATPKNEFLEVIRNRIAYCNQQFGHFKKGWKTDLGRILIRHGVPYEIIKGRTDILAKHGSKDYQIWKYRVNKNLTFIFLDLKTSGDYRLIYSENDDRESSYQDWQEYMGTEFDTGILY